MLAAIGETFETPYSEEADATSSSSADSPPSSSSQPISPAPLPSTFSNEITGVIVSVRKAFYRINIWTRTSSPDPAHKARIENIGRHFKYGVLGFDKGLTFSERDKVSSDVEFVSHSDSQQKVRARMSLCISAICFFPGGRIADSMMLATNAVWHQDHQVDGLISRKGGSTLLFLGVLHSNGLSRARVSASEVWWATAQRACVYLLLYDHLQYPPPTGERTEGDLSLFLPHLHILFFAPAFSTGSERDNWAPLNGEGAAKSSSFFSEITTIHSLLSHPISQPFFLIPPVLRLPLPIS